MIEMVCLDKRGYIDYLVVSINMSRLDFSKMSWVEVNSLGDKVLFLGENTNACCSAAELDLSKGCLYYTLLKDKSLYMFDVEDKCITTILPCSKLPTPWFSSEWIMMPLTVSVADGGRIMERNYVEEIFVGSDTWILQLEVLLNQCHHFRALRRFLRDWVVDLVKDEYLIRFLDWIDAYPELAAFVLAVIVDSHRCVQEASLSLPGETVGDFPGARNYGFGCRCIFRSRNTTTVRTPARG
ncbi:hypothetical protein C5167_024950 [Papaver somniferum]|uniref:KIB1-4 beta-propeller domain-containing protein n=1 Tax=Papaver somniferum TaxID=3469 RepID=A0A4Y7JR30_PAPSO|nr:hypothetical protein C5167_024950 [Papaver somniferum]